MANNANENVIDASDSRAALVRKEFNRNRKILLKNVPEITVEVSKGKSSVSLKADRTVRGLRLHAVCGRAARPQTIVGLHHPYLT